MAIQSSEFAGLMALVAVRGHGAKLLAEPLNRNLPTVNILWEGKAAVVILHPPCEGGSGSTWFRPTTVAWDGHYIVVEGMEVDGYNHDEEKGVLRIECLV